MRTFEKHSDDHKIIGEVCFMSYISARKKKAFVLERRNESNATIVGKEGEEK